MDRGASAQSDPKVICSAALALRRCALCARVLQHGATIPYRAGARPAVSSNRLRYVIEALRQPRQWLAPGPTPSTITLTTAIGLSFNINDLAQNPSHRPPRQVVRTCSDQIFVIGFERSIQPITVRMRCSSYARVGASVTIPLVTFATDGLCEVLFQVTTRRRFPQKKSI